MSDISNQLIKDSYNYVLQSDFSTGIVYRIGGGIPVNPIFLSGLTINSGFTYSNGTEQPGYALITDEFGNANWGPISGEYLSLSGGTITGNLIINSGLTANTISATTYLNLPLPDERRNDNNSTNNNINYCGTAPNGSSESSSVWTITRLTISSDGSVTTAVATNVKWDDRETSIYI